jgi:hypothetical protein
MTFAAVPRPPAAVGSGARRLALGVAVVVAGFVAVDVAFGNSQAAPIGAYNTANTYSFVSAPSLRPPQLVSDEPTDTAALAPGYIFTANFYNVSYPPLSGQSGPMILDDNLQPVWFDPLPKSVVASNLSLQTYDGKPALAWWQGFVTNTGATESGEDVVVNQHYHTVATLRGRDGWKLTLHEFVIRGDDAWVTANKDLPENLSKYGGAYNGALTDSAVQEYDLKTGRLLYSWDALHHIPPGDSQATLPTNGFPWDTYHVNSIQLVGSSSFLVSMRDTWAVYLVDIKTGRIIWTLGGKHSSFSFGPGAAFEWQHDVGLRSGSVVTLFDDHCCQLTGGGTYVSATAPSRALVLKLDQQTHTATLAAQYGERRNLNTEFMGDTELLPNGNVFVGWGSEPYLSEYSASGKLLLDAYFPGSDLTYRAMLEPWVGLPLYPPAGAARRLAGATTVYASWNGATQVASWRVLGGPRGGPLRVVASAPRFGFETAIRLQSAYPSYRVEAIAAGGRVLGRSKAFTS